MSHLHYIDNEVPWDGDYGEWTDRTQTTGTIVRAATAA